MIRQKVDYGKYRYSQKEILKYIGESAALCGAVDYLFYQTPWVMLLVVPVSVFFLKWKKKQMIRERKRRLNYQFRDALNSRVWRYRLDILRKMRFWPVCVI